MTRIPAIALVAALTTAGLVTTSTPASADTPGCVTKRELNKVGDTNYSKRRIHRIFDTRGRLYEDEGGDGLIVREYRGCGGAVDQAWVVYERRNGTWRWAGHSWFGG